jgi:hypothetical protein
MRDYHVAILREFAVAVIIGFDDLDSNGIFHSIHIDSVDIDEHPDFVLAWKQWQTWNIANQGVLTCIILRRRFALINRSKLDYTLAQIVLEN